MKNLIYILVFSLFAGLYSTSVHSQTSNEFLKKGQSFEATENIESAILCFNKAIEIKPQDFKAYYNKSIVYSLLNNKIELINSLKKAIELDNSIKDEAK